MKDSRYLQAPLFRGLGNRDWSLKTTLERACPLECTDPPSTLLEYYQKVARAAPVIETLGNRPSRQLPSYWDFRQSMNDDPFGWLDRFMSDYQEVWEYFVYLRHHGFPSPLLDWTTSPYVAAFFAFDCVATEASAVCIYVVLRGTVRAGSSDAHLFVIGPYMRSHPRHFLQQCRYTVCVGRQPSLDYRFQPHQSGLEHAVGPAGRLFKITIPTSERPAALKTLDRMNINSFSLFGSEDSLIRAVARRELLLGE